MKNKILLSIYFVFLSVSLIGCANTKNDENEEFVHIEEEQEIVPTPTIDPNIVYVDNSFVIYKNGDNNYADVIDGYEKATTIPVFYREYSSLLNHNEHTIDRHINSENLDFGVISSVDNAIEVSYDLYDYNIHSIVPIELDTDTQSIEIFNKNEETSAIRSYSILYNNDYVVYNSAQSFGNDVDSSLFISQALNKNLEDWKYFLSDIFILGENVTYEFTSNETFVSLFIDCSMELTYFEHPYYGKLCITLDKYDGTLIYSFIGYEETLIPNYNLVVEKNAIVEDEDIENGEDIAIETTDTSIDTRDVEIEEDCDVSPAKEYDALSKQGVLESFIDLYTITYTKERIGCM